MTPDTQEEELLDVPEAIERLSAALVLQHRSVAAYTLAAGSMVGYAYQAFAQSLAAFAREELDDARRLVEKITTLEGEPTTKIAPVRFSANPMEMVDILIEDETEVVEALQQAISPTGREGRSEALEHRLEHMIMRKQEQIDLLERARREPAG